MQINDTLIDDTFAEAFPMKATRLVITAHTPRWARAAADSLTGFATSVIDCGCEAGIEHEIAADATPDGRPGISVLMFAVSSKELVKQIARRVGQCVLTCPTTAVYNGIDPATTRAPLSDVAPLGGSLRFFGDGWQISKVLGGIRYWRVPVMDGEFVCEESVQTVKAVGGGNLLLLARDLDSALAGAEAAVAAMHRLANVITPFPGGVVRSGSKIGSKYKGAVASTNDAFCPTLTGLSQRSELDGQTGCVLEIVIDGLTDADVGAAMTAGIEAASAAGMGVVRISAGNYGGKLGPYHFKLRELAAGIVQRPNNSTTDGAT
ncbi:formylmethanofuran-tetrahydromethanopterin formyltransferase /formyltransferase/hydrolase complex subunit D [Burkholderia sp. YR290]|jgi:formylmethanofuran--tetrahydromethanopterin N-formyltransferase|uniref:formylmethanofuran--tetrahydromethanopterin N-formyltransferase n=1 Tax=Paraburkholderia hospita TaxID=169430 RepID=UPI0009A5EF31|nr:formylmethanofuran--tetrahydromethanopterin N-formyltransferase [Paraburkholderia hospita]SKD01492.1 formylmethanofuran-tetrahydromethanopterin formyltransferase /formyltransferase/hydrolase complex subunit D [Paraburkholderia hospita]SOE83941.1 formylmethanofuran-tetrahydromethanopterin formyltransferase /formyltransferase/hydrolase complex subunit D [Burkholderia sp. YR290]